jgi:hypothetical protein
MATTTYFGWTTPDDTSLVKDGAAAIRSLGSAIDASMQDLEGGTTGQTLTKNSNTDMDFVWATPASGGGMTLLSTTALSGASVSVTSISADYTDLLIIVSMLSTSSDGIITGTLNSNTTAGVYQLNNTGNASIPFTRGLDNDSAGTSAQNWVFTISQYKSSTFHKPLSITAGFVNAATGAQVTYADGGTFKSNTAVSSFQIATSAGTFDAGNIYIYGVK